MMIDALSVARFSLKDFWEELMLLVLLNVVWSLAALLPIIPVFVLKGVNPILVLALSLILFLPLPIVTGALAFVTNQISRGKAVGWETFAAGLRRYWAKSLVVALINLVVFVLLIANLRFYGTVLEGVWTSIAVSVWLVVGLYWLLVQVFWFPMILELESEQVFVALRNALAMVVITPGFSLTLGVIIVVLAVLCIALTIPVVLIMAALLLLVANHATRSRLAYAQKKPYEPGINQD
jgi:hypothetical protein